jgi:glycerol-3-phosphate dehydrogenase
MALSQKPMNRKENLEKLKQYEFEVLVLGAGASGAGVALDAALRGFKVGLIDKGDFVSETSAKSTKLIHGGVRYLEQAFKNLDFAQLKQVKHGLAERKFLLLNARHISKPLGIITPVFSFFEAFYYTIGLKLYGLFASKDHLPAARWISKKETHLLAPNISDKIHSAVMYFDGQLDDARFAFALAQTAEQQGVAAANYVEAIDFVKNIDGKIVGMKCKDLEDQSNFEIKAKYVINCTGPFADQFRLLANTHEEPRIKAGKGVHIVLDKRFFDSDRAMLIPKTKDGRLIFVIPFRESVMVGTTDTVYKDLVKEPVLENEEVAFLLDTVKDYLKEIPKTTDIKSGFGGLRPLISIKSKNPADTKTLLRDHEVEYDEQSGLISLLGGKWTTYRLMAQDCVDKLCKIAGRSAVSKTHEFPLWGSQGEIPFENIDNRELEVHEHLVHTYGDKTSEIWKLADSSPVLAERIHKSYPYLMAEVAYSSQFEMIQHPRDFFARRLRFEIMDWQAVYDSVEKVTLLMAQQLNWSNSKTQNEIEGYKTLLINFRQKMS